MKLFELFQASLPVKIFQDDARNFIGEFEDSDGNQYEFTVSELMKFDQDQPDIWSCQFSSGTDLILSTMINIIRSQIKEKNISTLYFEARNSEKSRVSLYRKLCQTFTTQMG
jgi:hypothetical protein